MSVTKIASAPWASTQEASSEAGLIFYVLPQDLKPAMIDPLLQKAVGQINTSGWVWTAESCQGHPDAASLEDTGWTHNVEPFLRLVCRAEHLGAMLAALIRAAEPSEEDMDRGIYGKPGLRLHASGRPDSEWAEVLVYIQAHNVMTRDAGCRIFERFAERAEGTPPT